MEDDVGGEVTEVIEVIEVMAFLLCTLWSFACAHDE